MQPQQNLRQPRAAYRWLMPVCFYLCSFLVAICAALLLHRDQHGTLATLSNFMGSLVENVAYRGAYVVCSDGMTAAGDVLCFHANRMPLPPLLLAGLIHIFGDHFRPIEVTKIALVLLPVAAAFALVWNRSDAALSRRVRIQIPLLLFASLLLPIQLIDVINMQVEEGYSFCLLAYALAVLLFGMRRAAEKIFMPWLTTIFFALSVLALYLTKSSMILASLFLVLAFCWQVRDKRKSIAVVIIFLCGPLGWGLYTLQTGHFSIGTSIDGMNLHKGNNLEFLERYPPPTGRSFDTYDAALNKGKSFEREWVFNEYHTHAAEDYIRTHPTRTIEAALWKTEVFFLSLHKIGSEPYTGWLGVITDISMLLFRLLLWSACGLAMWLLWRGPGTARWTAIIYLGMTLSVAAPYLVGFALTRHAGVLVLPSALFLCWWFVDSVEADITE